MATPQRTLSGTCEISTGTFTVINLPPAFTGEVGALKISVSFTNGGTSYSIPAGTKAQMYLYYASRDQMTSAVDMAVSGATATGNLGIDDTAVAGCPLLVIQLVDTASGTLIIACAVSMHIQRVRGEIRIHTSPPTPSEVVYVGRAPYISGNNHWMVWDNGTAQYHDSGVLSTGVGVASVCRKQPDSNGNVQLVASDVKARADTWMPTAAQVGARPDTWLPTAAQVGARPDTWLPTLTQINAMAADAAKQISFSLPLSAWSGSGPYTATISNASVTAKTLVTTMQCDAATDRNRPNAWLTLTTSAGTITISSALKPLGALAGYFTAIETK